MNVDMSRSCRREATVAAFEAKTGPTEKLINNAGWERFLPLPSIPTRRFTMIQLASNPTLTIQMLYSRVWLTGNPYLCRKDDTDVSGNRRDFVRMPSSDYRPFN